MQCGYWRMSGDKRKEKNCSLISQIIMCVSSFPFLNDLPVFYHLLQ